MSLKIPEERLDPQGEVEAKDEDEMQTLPVDEMETQPMEEEPVLPVKATKVAEDDSVGMHTEPAEEIMMKMIRMGDRSRLVLMQPPKILELLGLIERGELWLVEKAL